MFKYDADSSGIGESEPLRSKAPLCLVLTIILAGGVGLAIVHFGTAQTLSTNVGGTISSNTTWTQTNSPYALTGNVLVNNGVT